MVENERDALAALEELEARGCNALVVFLGISVLRVLKRCWLSGFAAR
jgi:hypothetical protein